MFSEGVHSHLASVAIERLEFHLPIGHRQYGCGVFGPLGELQARRREHIAKTGVGPLARILEAVEVKMRDREAIDLVGFEHGKGGAFDSALHTERAQEVAHKGRLAGTERALQGDETIGPQGRQRGEPRGESGAARFVGPVESASF